MKKSVIVLLLGIIMVTINSKASETKVSGRLYSYWMMDLSDYADNANEFGLSRAYVTVKSKLSDYTSVRITTDLRKTTGFNGYSIILKYGYLDWTPKFGNNNLKFRFGLQPTQYIDYMNKLWRRRYLEKTVSDFRGFLTTSDFGAGLFINLGKKGKFGSVAINVWNGTKYTDITEKNKYKDLSGFILLKPFTSNVSFERTKLVGQYYLGTQNLEILTSMDVADYDRKILSLGGILGYRNTVDIGIDLNWNTEAMGPSVPDITESGLSFFGTFYFRDLAEASSFISTLNLFGRVDLYDPDTDTDNDAQTTFFGGVETVPVKGFKASVNFRTVNFEDDTIVSKTYLYFNTLFKF